MKTKTVLCSWTGGLDSTGMVHRYLNEGWIVIPVYTEIRNNPNKTKRELQALENLRDLMPNSKNLYPIRKTVIEIPIPQEVKLPQLFAILTSLAYSSSSDVDHVSIGYVMNDDSMSFLNEIRSIWNKMTSMMHHAPPIKFPMKKYRKSDIWLMLSEKQKQYLTWGEDEFEFQEESQYCGKCIPCRRIDYAGIFHDREIGKRHVIAPIDENKAATYNDGIDIAKEIL